jgi:rod shape determining protein RodA
MIILLAKLFQGEASDDRMLKDIAAPLISLMVPFVLILTQPDLGTALVLAVLFVTMVLVAGFRPLTLVPLILGGLALLPLVWRHLKPYQQKRILTFFNPELDPLGAGYHALQSKIAIGSGQITGQGFLKGTQNRLYFLPEQHTDFVFSVFAEEWGFIGATVLVALYLFLVLWALRIAQHARDQFGALLATGVAAMLFWQVIVNIAMVTGLLPVVGIPLPLMSYGGSSLITVMVGIGLLINVSMRRFTLMRI